MVCYISVGSNIGDRVKNIDRAICYLRKVESLKIKRISAVYETQPQGGPQGQGDYLNLVIEADIKLSPYDLLCWLKAIEKKVGRKYRRLRWARREIDLDILLYGNAIVVRNGLVIPHLSMHERFFVLKPLCDLRPELIHPLKGVSMESLLGSLNYAGRWQKTDTAFFS